MTTRPGAGAFRAHPRTSTSTVDTSWQEIALTAVGQQGEPAARIVDASGVGANLAVPPPGVIAFNGGYLHPSLQPEQALGAAFARAARRPGARERLPLEGLTPLRAWFAREVGGGITAAQVLITAGGQAALTTALHALCPPGFSTASRCSTTPPVQSSLPTAVAGSSKSPTPQELSSSKTTTRAASATVGNSRHPWSPRIRTARSCTSAL